MRQKAEALAREQAARTPEDSVALSHEEIRKTLHELRVHQIEMEMQNEELRTAQAELEKSRERYFDLYDLAPVGYCTVSERGLILEANLTAATLLGTAHGALVKQPISRFILKEDQDIYYLHRKKLFETGEPQEFDLRLVKPEGALFWAHLEATAAQSEDGAPVCRVVISDITARKQAEEKIHQMAYYDSLTGLPNRQLFSDRLAVALTHARRNHRRVAVAMFDLDNFKDVNDNLGHDVGDLLLKAAAERLSAALRESDTVARFGGDEFVLVLPDLKQADDVIPAVRKIVESFREPFLIGAHQLFVTTSIGIAVHPDDGTQENILLKNADSAMYQAKQTGRNRYQIYNKG